MIVAVKNHKSLMKIKFLTLYKLWIKIATDIVSNPNFVKLIKCIPSSGKYILFNGIELNYYYTLIRGNLI